MTTLAIFGGTGRTGRRVLERALTAGHDVRALVRDPAKLTTVSDRLTVIHGDVLDSATVDRTVGGADAVLALFGQVKGSPPSLQTDGTRLIVDAMKRHGVRRVVTLSGGGLRADEVDQPKAPDKFIRFLLTRLAPQVIADAEGHLQLLRSSGLDWTVVRGGRLLERPGKGTYRVGWVGVNTSTQISRDDLADFILTQVDDTRFVGQLPFASN